MLVLFLVGIYEAKVIIAVLLDIYFFISCLLLLLRFFLNVTNWNHKNIDFVVYSASSLWRHYKETSRGLHSATWAATSFPCIMNCAETEDR